MATSVTIPPLGESITEATVGQWLKAPGDPVKMDEPIVSLETDKVAVEVPSPIDGIMGAHLVEVGDIVSIGATIGFIEAAAAPKSALLKEPTAEPARDPEPAAATPSLLQPEPEPEAAPTPEPLAAGSLLLKPEDEAPKAQTPLLKPRVPAEPQQGAEPEAAPTIDIQPASVEPGAEPALETPAVEPAAASPATEPEPALKESAAPTGADDPDAPMAPSVRRLIGEYDLDPTSIVGTGKDARLTKSDVLSAIEAGSAKLKARAAGEANAAEAPRPTADEPAAEAASEPVHEPAPEPVVIEPLRPAAQLPATTPPPVEVPTVVPVPALTPAPARAVSAAVPGRPEERVRMTRLRQTIGRRLKEAQNTAAMLTTFNDVDMTAVMETRSRYKDLFERKHGVRLGFMSFFIQAAVLALRDVPSVNASIDGDEIVYHGYADIGIAVASPGGLVVPVLKDADKRNFAQIEKAIADFGKRAQAGQLKLEDMQGGTFTVTNGGVFGSLMSTPILNPPQSGVLGMHRIEDRPVVVKGQIVIRPMMYLALSYDHRLVDGREAVTFLVRVKEAIEDPTRLLVDL